MALYVRGGNMKYIRILTILAVALLLWTTAGCHADFMDDPAVAEPGVHIADTSRTGFISSKEDFVDVIGTTPRAANYSCYLGFLHENCF